MAAEQLELPAGTEDLACCDLHDAFLAPGIHRLTVHAGPIGDAPRGLGAVLDAAEQEEDRATVVQEMPTALETADVVEPFNAEAGTRSKLRRGRWSLWYRVPVAVEKVLPHPL